MKIHSIIRVLILITISIMAVVITDGIHMYCIADDNPSWGYVYARNNEEFVMKTGLPTVAMDSCAVSPSSKLVLYRIEAQDGEHLVLATEDTATDTLLVLAGVKLTDLDVVERDGNTIKVLRGHIIKDTKLVRIPAPSKQVIIEKKHLPKGYVRLLSKARDGLKEVTTYTYVVGGKIVKRWTEEKIIRQPTPYKFLAGPPEYTGKYIKSFVVLVTAYSPEDPGVNDITATGDKVKRGVVAVDPRIIPLRSKLYVEGYGKSVALDTGGWIKGYHIDIFFPTKEEALKWGVRYKRIYILEYPKGRQWTTTR